MTDDQAMTEPAGPARRTLLLGTGSAGATMLLAACGGSTGRGDSTRSRDEDGARLGKVSDIPVGGGVVFASQSVVVTQPVEGAFKAFSAICTHQGCRLAGIDGDTINCGCHGSAFSVADGSVKRGPARKPLPAKEIKVDGENITLA